MISLGEIERIARLLFKQNSKLSSWSLLLLIEISKNSEWQKLRDVVNRIYPGKSYSDSFIFKPLVENQLIQMRKTKSTTSQFDSWEVKLAQGIHLLDDDIFDVPVVNKLASMSQTYMRSYSRTSNLLMLVLIAIVVRKLPTTNEIFRFCQAKHRTEDKIICRLADLGFIQLVKTDDYKKSSVAIFEVE
ncbi:hypothetical protein [Shewanella frigidimarina]|uniref:hypothetical protein n=1 Tax=Shewanella frigidimarina TaxID=56812 RepID=UPI003D79AE02